MPQYDYDLITIGGGSGGVRASRFAAAQYGAKTAVVENLRIGGTCVMRGCVPKKLLVYGAHFAEDFEDARGYGWEPGEPAFDWQRLIANKNRELDRLEGVYHRLLRDAGVDELTGTGRVVDAHTVEVAGPDGVKTRTAKYILIATGGWPSLPDIPGIEHAITSNEALDLDRLPNSIAIVGGGYIAVEFAGIFNAFGAETHVVIRAENILRGFDQAVRDTLHEEMVKKGVVIHQETRVQSIEKTAAGYSLRLDDDEILEVETVMYATGRAPNSRGIGLEEAGVRLAANGAVVVDDYFRTSVDSIYALGDVIDRVQLTPVALAEGMAVAHTLFGGRPTKVDYAGIPTAVFSTPPVGTVGLTEEAARRDYDIDVYQSHFRPMKYTLSGRDEHTVMKMIVDRKTGRVLGCHMVGLDAAEMTQALGIAMKAGATKAHFDATIGIHPTAAEEWVTMRTPVRPKAEAAE
ncbi:MAG: glutathione-disulfide reductase [Rhodospirillales bacterium CG15_BIG_FIL_POST_REV_8_21_14_020_66_15]|nr:MAG: glutathione-disulfide reductase [Rhodospirillales bacterium CG15_BIG_FIL_POST_REV_8_21_14_020_66_15]